MAAEPGTSQPGTSQPGTSQPGTSQPGTSQPGTGQHADPGGEVHVLVGDCVHCGFCLPACPTYQLWGEEMDSPRGRIHLMTQVLATGELTESAVEHFDRCLGCMACVPACPSGVRYDRLIEAARTWTEEAPPAAVVRHPPRPADPEQAGERGGRPEGRGRRRSPRDRAARAAIFALFPYPPRLRAAVAPLRAAQRAGLDRLLTRGSLPARLSPVLGEAIRLAPPPPGRVPRLPGLVAARGPRRAVVGMLTGCVQGVFFPQVNTATARVLAAEGCDVIIPNGQGCCGALSLHAGRRDEAVRLAKRLITTFERADVEAIVINSAGCGSAMKEYGYLLAREEGWAERAERFSAMARDFSEFLDELGPAAPRHPLPLRAVYHDACHLGNAQRIKAQPRALLRAIPGLEIAETGDGGTCCGSAGVYNLLQPEAARELGQRKAARVWASGAELLISANPGCSLQIASALQASGVRMPVAHTAQVLDTSLRGLSASVLLK